MVDYCGTHLRHKPTEFAEIQYGSAGLIQDPAHPCVKSGTFPLDLRQLYCEVLKSI